VIDAPALQGKHPSEDLSEDLSEMQFGISLCQRRSEFLDNGWVIELKTSSMRNIEEHLVQERRHFSLSRVASFHQVGRIRIARIEKRDKI